MSIAEIVVAVVMLALGSAYAYVRLAPSDPAQWHADPGPGAIGRCDQIVTTANTARVGCLRPDVAQALLARLDAIALSTPRTTRLAGSPESGRITWITRSALIGYPDFTTAQAVATEGGTRLDILARSRFGGSDFGVNAKRLKLWTAAL